MKVVHFASELSGGAGIAALRLHKALIGMDVSSSLFYGRGQTGTADSEAFLPSGSVLRSYADRVFDQLTWRTIRQNETLFTRTRRFSKGGIDELVRDADLVHLHWIAKWLDLESLFHSIPHGTPVVLSLHDASFFSGGCHQPDSCRKFEDLCKLCPKLKFGILSPSDLARKGFQVRRRSYLGKNITAVPNSSWTESLAARAKLLADATVTSPIFPGIDTSAFSPLDRKLCRSILSIPPERFVIAAGCADLFDPNKGIQLLLDAVVRLPSEVRARTCLLTYGSGSLPEQIGGVEIRQMGFVGSERLLSVIYSAADVYCTPSLMETFGMTVVEALSCGVPVVAFGVGAIPEIVHHRENGWLARLGDSQSLIDGFEWVDGETRAGRSSADRFRNSVVEKFDIGRSARSFGELYTSLISR